MDTEDEGCDQGSPKSDESDIDDSERDSSSETEESSEVDEDTIEIRKSDCLADGHELEKAFQIVKNLLYEERMKQIDGKLEGLENGTAIEYLKPLKQLDAKLEKRTQVAATRKSFKLNMIDILYESEILATEQNFKNDQDQLIDTVRNELEEKIRRLEEDRNNIDLHSDLWESQLFSKKPKLRKGGSSSRDRRRKPVIVTGPYIIYMLDEMEVLEDWTTIKKAVKQRQQLQKKVRQHVPPDNLRSTSPPELGPMRSIKNSTGKRRGKLFYAKYRNGRLDYNGDHYNRGHHIIIDVQGDPPVHATIQEINTGEIRVKKADGNSSKLYIAQLQKGKYSIRHVPPY